MHLTLSRVGGVALAVGMVLLSACNDRVNPTAISPEAPPQRFIAGGGSGDRPPLPPSLSSVSLSTTTLAINGSASYSASVNDPSGAFGLSLHSFLVQGGTTLDLGGIGLSCGGAAKSCTGSGAFVATGLTPGAATFRVQLLNADGLALSTTNGNVTIVPQVTLGSVAAALVLEGPSNYSITLQNGGSEPRRCDGPGLGRPERRECREPDPRHQRG